MSISKVHELIQNKGCVWTVSILMILSMVVGSFTMCGPQNRFNSMGDRPRVVVGKVGTHEITDMLVESELAKGAQAYGGLNNLPPNFLIQMQAGALRGIVGNILQIDLAKKYGIEPSDEQIEKLVVENIEQEAKNQRQQFVMQGRLAETSTDAEFATLYKKEFGRELSEVKANAKEMNLAVLKSGKDMRIPFEAMTIGEPLMAAIKKEVKLTDDELKKTYDSFEFKRITLQKGNPDETAKKIVADLKGGLSFEQAMDRYDEAPKDPKKKPSEKTEAPMQRITLDGFEAYAPLAKLKPGEVSPPITIGQSVNLFKLIKVTNETPKDFATKKDTYRETQLASLAAAKLQKDLMAAMKEVKVEWTDPGYRLLYEYGRISAENLSADDRATAEKKLLEDSIKTATDGEANQSKIAGSLAYVILQGAEEKATTPEAKKALEADKIKVYELYLLDTEDPALRIQLVNIYKAKKDKEKFAEQLMAAANGNSGQADATGQGIWSQINGLIREGKSSGLLTSEQVKEIESIQASWSQNKADQDKWDAEAKKEADKAAAEAKKAADAEAKKGIDKVKTRAESEKEKAGGKK